MIMKRFIYILAFLLGSLGVMAQTQPDLPSGAVPYGNQLFKDLSGNVWSGRPDLGYTNLGAWLKADSLASMRVAYVPDIPALEAYEGLEDAIVVTDTLRGGLFVHQPTGEDDGGTVFNATGRGDGYWHRQFNTADGLNVIWYGADPTGAVDCAEIMEDVIYLYSRKTGKVIIPIGHYRIDRGIGDLPAVGQGVKKISHDVAIEGLPGAEIFVGGSSQVAHIIGFDVLESKVSISGLKLDGSGLANRGVYMRQAVSTPADYSDFTATNISVRNIYGGAGSIHNRANGINIYGKWENVRIEKCKVDNVITSGDVYSAEGIAVAGSQALNSLPKNVTVANSYVHNVRVGVSSSTGSLFGIWIEGDLEMVNVENNVVDSITGVDLQTVVGILVSGTTKNKSTSYVNGNTVSNIFKDVITVLDQDGIYISRIEPVLVSDEISSFITNNKIINSRGRAIKIQNTNTQVKGNHIILEDGFEMPPPPQNPAVDFQYSSGVLENNIFTFNNSTHYFWAVNFYKRTSVTSVKPIIARGNKLYATGTMNAFVRIYENTLQIRGNTSISDNYIDATLNQLVQFNSASSDVGSRQINVVNNSIKQTSLFLVTNSQAKNVSIYAENNTNLSSSVPIADTYASMVSINNLGFSGSSPGSASFTGPVRAAAATSGNELATLDQVNAAPFVNLSTSQSGIGGNKSWTGRHTFAPSTPGTVSQGAVDVSFSSGSGVFIRAGRTSSSGNAFILRGYATDGVQLDLNEGAVLAPQYRLSALNTAPASATATGTTGEIRVTATYIYVCTATNTWVRAALTTW